MSENKLKLHMALEVIHRLDIAQESRPLADAELLLRKGLKRQVLGYAVVERSRKRQASRITNLKEGDANTRFFHLKANARRRKNHIQRLQVNGGWAITHEEKAILINDHFTEVMSTPPEATLDFNWDLLNIPRYNLNHLEESFSEEEVRQAILQLPSEKAPGPDGFTGIFFKH
ncbi:hypothetical protein PVAP13_1NG173519 [Panicum virgatum]|uniref:Uncharacterized protein n=1 Tax=Panicum virgatum TaxID=38727 RepID=A0A8T0WYP4_PANVG|nr:hypothetical protein PVAP13_1NG173519 [Panicum virgatum]